MTERWCRRKREVAARVRLVAHLLALLLHHCQGKRRVAAEAGRRECGVGCVLY